MQNNQLVVKYLVFLLMTISVVSGCTDVRPPENNFIPITFSDDEVFGARPDIIDADEIFQLSDKQKEEFLKYFNHPVVRDAPPHERVYNYLKRILSNFNYQGDTYTAEVALRTSSGNCLSLAIITTALARLAKVDIGYQLVDDVPVFEQKGQVIFKGVHVRSLLYFTYAEYDNMSFYIGRPFLKIDYFPSGNERFIRFISESEYIAMFYRNRAAESVARGEYATAYWLAKTSLEYQPDSSQAINIMAVIHRQANKLTRAEELYKYGIQNTDDRLSLLKNYRILLNQQGRFDEAEQLNNKIAALADPSPFNWMHLAEEAYVKADYSDAIRYYKKAIDIAPYLHEGHFGMAKSYYQLGRYDAAKREMRQAMKQAFKQSTKSLYQAKLIMLSESHQ